ncbi:hypothetical protein AB0M79_26430 [Polymorphospora sp. NPDC051019]|uniref:hypothetical protein n=1 Tax=Polymorphospora sp. NPDC051019 TaxID=3155725 RepID=UPI003419593C
MVDPAEPAPSGGVPLLVVGYPVQWERARFDASTRAVWASAEASLGMLMDAMQRGGNSTEVARRFEFAVDSTAALAARLDAIAPVEEPWRLPPPVPVHSDYFRVRHTPLTPHQQAAQTAVAVFRTLADLRLTMLEINDVLAEVASMSLLFRLLRPASAGGTNGSTPDGPPVDVPAGPPPTQPAAPNGSAGTATPNGTAAGTAAPDGTAADMAAPDNLAESAAAYRPDGDWMDRWFLVHHYYFVLNVYAAALIHRAVEHTRAGADGPAAAALADAAVLIRGFTAAMIHSGAMPAKYYQDVVRPTMSPPYVPINLTGVMQIEHRRYRAAVEELITAVPEPYADLMLTRPELADARDEVLEADLLDLERHITLAAVLVGGERSLVQPGTTTQNATSTLRKMRHMRAANYCPLMQFGDRWLTRMSR